MAPTGTERDEASIFQQADEWIDPAYGRYNDRNGTHYTRYNMQVAFLAGYSAGTAKVREMDAAKSAPQGDYVLVPTLLELERAIEPEPSNTSERIHAQQGAKRVAALLAAARSLLERARPDFPPTVQAVCDKWDVWSDNPAVRATFLHALKAALAASPDRPARALGSEP